jgi:hypothetical protein
MAKMTQPTDPQGVFCEACLKLVPRSESLSAEGRDYVAYFCGADCYDRWHRQRPPLAEPGARDIQEGAGRSISRDERVKHAAQQHPQRDEPKADSVEPDELPPA